MLFTEEHESIRRTVAGFIEKEVNPHVDQWEAEGIFPAHELFKKAGDLGLLGISKPVEYGGMGLDYSYNMVALEELPSFATCAFVSVYFLLSFLRVAFQLLALSLLHPSRKTLPLSLHHPQEEH